MDQAIMSHAPAVGGLQLPFDAAVVIATVLKPTLTRAVCSVFNQSFAGRIHVLIGVDPRPAGDEEAGQDRRPGRVAGLGHQDRPCRPPGFVPEADAEEPGNLAEWEAPPAPFVADSWRCR